MGSAYYESEKVLAEYILFHYGSAEEILPYTFGPRDALHYPERCVSELLDPSRLPSGARGLDLGCAVGRSTFELARHCAEVVGVDASQRFIQVARHLQHQGSITYAFQEEGDLTCPATAVVPPEIDRSRARFEQADAQALPAQFGSFDVILMANLIDRLPRPRRCLSQLAGLVRPQGQLILTSPYTWLEEYTPRDQWLGGLEEANSPVRTLDSLKRILNENFDLLRTKPMPFLLREHARKFQWSVAEASIWRRRGS